MNTEKPKQLHIYPSDGIKYLLRKNVNRSLSGTLNRAVDRYLHILRASEPVLTDTEKQAIFNCLSASEIDSIMVEYLEQEIEDFDDLTQNAVHYPELVEKIRNMSIAQRYALLESLGI